MAAPRSGGLSCALALLLVALGAAPLHAALGKVSQDDERSTGAEVDAQIREQVELIDDPVVLGFINELGQRIVARIEPQPFIYRFRVIPEDSLNAFALPGGYVYFHSGTILQAASLEELAGVMGHEIAHVKARHYARGREKAFIPNLLATAAGLAVAVATGEPGAVAAAQGVNVALQLKYTREFEAEADELGATFMARSGFEPAGMGVFFERIIAANRGAVGFEIPPYLYSHPDLEDRIDAVEARAGSITVTGTPGEGMRARFREAQARLGMLVAMERTRHQDPRSEADRSRATPVLDEAAAARRAGDDDRALALLAGAEAQEIRDPRIPFQRGELLASRGRQREAIAAWRRAIALDPSVGLAYYRVGLAHRHLGERHMATYYLEQAERRFEPGGRFRARTQQALETLRFPPVLEAGVADGSAAGNTAGGLGRTEFAQGDPQAVWWAEIDKRYAAARDRIQVRWLSPDGAIAQEAAAESRGRREVVAPFALPGGDAALGIWRIEATLDDHIIDRRTFRYVPAP